MTCKSPAKSLLKVHYISDLLFFWINYHFSHVDIGFGLIMVQNVKTKLKR